MAVTPVGNPYVESSDLVANYPGTSEALAERIDIVGVNPFADSAARATAIPSPVEGQMASLNDDDKVYRYSGSAWVAVGLPPGLNPAAPTSIANSGGSASTSGNTTTFAGVTSLTLNGVFTSAYKNYTAIIKFVKSGDAYAYLRLSAAATPASSSNYQRNSIQKGSGGSLSGSNGTDTSVQLGELERDIRATFNFIGPQLAENTGIFSSLLYNENLEIRFVRHNLTTQYDGLNLTISGGNFTSGTIQVFGYKD